MSDESKPTHEPTDDELIKRGMTVVNLLLDIETLKAERNIALALLQETWQLLGRHHNAEYKIDWGEPCPVCRTEGDFETTLLGRVQAALATAADGDWLRAEIG